MSTYAYPEKYIGNGFTPAVKNTIKLTLSFTKAVGAGQDDKNDNLVVSPYNALGCLSMVAAGADGKTREEMAQALFGTDAKSLDASLKDYADLNREILAANKDKVTLATANGVWANKELIQLDDRFARKLKNQFGAEVSNVPFSDAATVPAINKFASDNTNKLIPSVLEELDANAAAVLVSTLYFKGEWTNKFDKKDTKEKTFTLDSGVQNKTQMMRKKVEEGQMGYLKTDEYEAVSLTYGKQDRKNRTEPSMRLILIRPSDVNVSARELLASQADGKLPVWSEPNAFRDAEGSIELPHMDMKQRFDLIPALESMGIKAAFDSGKADFNPMLKSRKGGNMYVSAVSHDTVFKTNEEGSEAAAATTAVMGLECVRMPPPRVDIKFNRSFAFALQDIKTGALMFIGAVNKPNKDMKPAPAVCPR